MHLNPEVFHNLIRHKGSAKAKFSRMSKLNCSFVYRVLRKERGNDKKLFGR